MPGMKVALIFFFTAFLVRAPLLGAAPVPGAREFSYPGTPPGVVACVSYGDDEEDFRNLYRRYAAARDAEPTSWTSTASSTSVTTSSTVPSSTSVTTSWSATTTSRSKTASTTNTPVTLTPTLNPSNTILRADCTYLPVPFIVPDASKTANDVFNIELVTCSANKTFDSYFVAAAQKWMSIITSDVYNYPLYKSDCVRFGTGAGDAVMSCQFVDDIIIGIMIEAIDGPSHTVGNAGPVYMRGGDPAHGYFLPLTGSMRFDSADMDDLMARNILEDIIVHEMGHILGFGSLWIYSVLLSPSNCVALVAAGNTVSGARFLGAQANSTLPAVDPNNYLGLTYVPVEDGGGNGTSCTHWKESVFKKELMTGWLPNGGGTPLSLTTVMSLADLGYGVNTASPYISLTFDLGDPTMTPDHRRRAVMEEGGVWLTGCTDVFGPPVVVPMPE
ncbi:hypothetical protein DFJ74DRAFT_765005 [Hyaloraphidium curvatum]|nr:hypothetical protein DFJ74DRAFT_765005 [Hyaloraphidium curvatum]